EADVGPSGRRRCSAWKARRTTKRSEFHIKPLGLALARPRNVARAALLLRANGTVDSYIGRLAVLGVVSDEPPPALRCPGCELPALLAPHRASIRRPIACA